MNVDRHARTIGAAEVFDNTIQTVGAGFLRRGNQVGRMVADGLRNLPAQLEVKSDRLPPAFHLVGEEPSCFRADDVRHDGQMIVAGF